MKAYVLPLVAASFLLGGVAVAAPQAPSCAEMPKSFRGEMDAQKKRVFLALFWASWSAPDRLMIASLDTELAKDPERWHLRKIDIDREADLAEACEIRSIPTLVAFVRGRAVAQVVGALSPSKLRKFLDAIPK